jgi:sugar/nucleoside kinase (ribokinase family)
MVDVVIIGTMAYDDVETPFGKKEKLLGGSATYASLACNFFAKPGVVAIIGEDFNPEYKEKLETKGISLSGVEVKGKTFHWSGKYEYDMNEAKTLDTQLNSLLDFNPVLPAEYQDAKFIFLANTDPELQLKVIEQVKDPQMIILDTMNFWIDTKKDKLLEVISKVNALLINDGEARQLFDSVSLMQCAQKALKLGPDYIIIKKGEHGALLFTKEGKHFNAPGYPLAVLKDPTGCGDCFAGGFIGYLAKLKNYDEKDIRKAIVYGSTIASFNAEDFSMDRIDKLTEQEIESRFAEFRAIREF